MANFDIPTVQSALLLFVVSFISYHLYLAFFHPLADIPGPVLGRFSELWKFQHMIQADFSDALDALHKKYGPLVRLAPNVSAPTFALYGTVIDCLRIGSLNSRCKRDTYNIWSWN